MRLGTMILLIRNNPGFDSKKTRAGSVPALYYVLNIKKKEKYLKEKENQEICRSIGFTAGIYLCRKIL